MKLIKVVWAAATSKSVGFLLAVGGIGIAVFSIWFYHPRPALSFAIGSSARYRCFLMIRRSDGAGG